MGQQGEKAAKERCTDVVGESLGCKEGQRVRHGDKEVRPEAGGHCIKDNAKKNTLISLKKSISSSSLLSLIVAITY